MRILVLDANYPHEQNLYGDVFVHVRVKRYLALGHDVRVVAFFTDRGDYSFDGVSVQCARDIESLRRVISETSADVIAVHFFQGWMLRKLFVVIDVPVVIWVHGVEALGWYRRLFNFSVSRAFAHYVVNNTIQMARFRKLIHYARSTSGKVQFVFVSDWMRRITERDTFATLPSYEIIPNPIDTERFPYRPKEDGQRLRVLLIRSFDSRKYANDIAVDAILHLSRFPEFTDFHFSVCGNGTMFDELTDGLRQFRNVSVRKGFLTHMEISALHALHGVFLCPTRQDAQGVSMCEAMSSGLVPITSRSSAIPEFVSDGESGFLTGGSVGIVDALRLLHRDPELFDRMSAAAARSIRDSSPVDAVVSREIALMSSARGKYQ